MAANVGPKSTIIPTVLVIIRRFCESACEHVYFESFRQKCHCEYFPSIVFRENEFSLRNLDRETKYLCTYAALTPMAKLVWLVPNQRRQCCSEGFAEEHDLHLPRVFLFQLFVCYSSRKAIADSNEHDSRNAL